MPKIISNRVIAKNRASVGDDISKSFRYKGFSSKEYKKNYKLYDFDLVKQDLINHFYIRKGEKLENPNFGTIIWDVLFENFTAEIKAAISKNVEEIINFDKRVKINAVSVDTTEQGMRIEVELVYLPLDLVDVLRLDFDKNNNIIN
jgi:phage baseplate assembly protein W